MLQISILSVCSNSGGVLLLCDVYLQIQIKDGFKADLGRRLFPLLDCFVGRDDSCMSHFRANSPVGAREQWVPGEKCPS